MVHILFTTIGTVLFMIVMSIMQHYSVFGSAYWTRSVDSGVIANFQTVFNLLTAVALIPFTNVLVKMSMALVRDDKPQLQRHPELHTLDEKLYISPAVAVSEATKAVAAMGQVAKTNFERGCSVLIEYTDALLADVDADEDCLDQFADASDRFLIGLSKAV